MTRYLDDRPLRRTLWFQAAADVGGQTWSGGFEDRDGNGVLEFAPAAQPLPTQRWTNELNFLAWQPFAGARALDLPAGDPGLGSALNLKVCIALKERVYAAGMTFEGRPPFGLRLPGTAYYEHFSRTSTQGGKVRVTYWLQDDKGFDVTLSRSPDGGWVVEKVETWGVVAMR